METLQRKEITRAKVYTKTARFPDLIYGRETSPQQDWFGVWSKSNCTDLTYPLHSLPVSFRDFAVAQSKLASKLGCRLPIARFPGQHKLIEGPKRAGAAQEHCLSLVVDGDCLQYARHGNFQNGINNGKQSH